MPASSASLDYVGGLGIDPGDLYIASKDAYRVYKVDTSGSDPVAGAGWRGYSGESGPATQGSSLLSGAACDNAGGNVYIADLNNVVRKVNSSGTITTYAGNGSRSYSGDGVATGVGLCSVYSLATGGTNLYIGSSCNRIFEVNMTGALTTIAGNGINGYSGDGDPALLASISQPKALGVDGAGNVYFADANNYRIRKIERTPTSQR